MLLYISVWFQGGGGGGGWGYFQGLLLWTRLLSLALVEELSRLRALGVLDWELTVDMRLDIRPAGKKTKQTHANQEWGTRHEHTSHDNTSKWLLIWVSLLLLGTCISSSCSWILLSSSDENRHLFSAACCCCCWTELFFPFMDMGEDRHEAGMAPVVIPSGNFWAITLRPERETTELL